MLGRRSARPAAALTAAVFAVGLFASACGGSSGGGSSSGGGGSIAKEPTFQGATFTVGSKDFDEQLVLGQLTIQVLEAAGAKVNDKTGLAGTAPARAALLKGDVDMYWEYTGTGWITHLKNTTPIPDEQAQFDAVAKEDLAKNKIVWVSPYAPFNNTYAIATRAAFAQQNNLKTDTDVANYVKAHPDQATFCVESEFSTRDDGFPGFQKKYGFTVPASNIKLLDTGVVYTETQKGQTCNFGEVFTTDGRIKSLNLSYFQDDKKFFPNYNPSLNVRQDVYQKYPAIQKVIQPVFAKLDNNTMSTLNAKVSAEGDEPKTVAKDWLQQNGFIK
jgi:osmoprotectant transport system substrate-binding protein